MSDKPREEFPRLHGRVEAREKHAVDMFCTIHKIKLQNLLRALAFICSLPPQRQFLVKDLISYAKNIPKLQKVNTEDE